MNSLSMHSGHQGQVVARYRKAMNWSQQDLAEALQVDLRTVQRIEKQPMIKNINRRRLLVGLLGIPVALMGLEIEPRDTEQPTIVNDDRMAFFENEMATRWEMLLIGGPLRAARGLRSWLQEIERFTWAAQGTSWHKRTLALLSMNYQLQGSIAGDRMDYIQAQSAYKKAFKVALELDDYELMGAALTRQGFTFMRQEKPLEAITSLTAALESINGRGLPGLRGNILNVLSEAYAQSRQPQACWRSIGLAERVLENREHVRERSHRLFDASAVSAHKGIDALLLHDYQRAIALIDKSLTTYNPTLTPGRARLIARKAEAYYGLGEIDTCVAYAEETLMLARSVGASNTITRVQSLYTTLAQSRWRKEQSVARLGALLSLQQCEVSG